MSIVSSSHTPQGRGEEKGANYKWPHPVLPDFSSCGIGPRFISAQAALRHDPPRLPGAPRCHEVRDEAARSRPPAGRGPWPLLGAPRLPRAVPRGHRARASPLPAAAANGAHAAGLRAQVQSRAVRPRVRCRRPGSARRPGGTRGEIAVACTSVRPAVERGGGGGGNAACAARFSERVQSLGTHP